LRILRCVQRVGVWINGRERDLLLHRITLMPRRRLHTRRATVAILGRHILLLLRAAQGVRIEGERSLVHRVAMLIWSRVWEVVGDVVSPVEIANIH